MRNGAEQHKCFRQRPVLAVAVMAAGLAVALLAGFGPDATAQTQEEPPRAAPAPRPAAIAPATNAPAANAPTANTPAANTPATTTPRPAASAPRPAGNTPASNAPAANPATEQRPAAVEGFRSARFGMTEAEVRRAVQADFPALKETIKKESNAVEQTEALTAMVADLLPNAPPAQVSYIFGHKTRKLIQVNILWPYPAASARTAPNGPLANATSLRNYFLEQAWKRDSLVVDGQVGDGLILVFRGQDAKNRQVQLLMLPPQAAQEGGEKKPGQDGFMRLSYIENAAEPDIFRIKPGQF